jgi:uncharacterized protein involved in type VI secretion and phage assembly
MSLPNALAETMMERESPNRIYGVVTALVTNNDDPDGLGRVKVNYPWLSNSDEGYWARIAAPMAGAGRGIYFLPEVNDELLVAFEQGDLRFPYVLGALWNGKDAPPEKNEDGKNNIRVIKSRSGHVVRLTDKDGEEKIEIIDKSQKNKLVFDTAKNAITITAEKDITLLASGGTIRLEAQKVEIKSSADTGIEAGAGMNVKSTGTMNIKGGMVNIN